MSSLSFIFDNKPSESSDLQQSSSELKYSLFNETVEVIKCSKVRKKCQNTCFNCLETNHSIKDCKKTKNFNRIQNEKIKHQFFSSYQQSTSRYHNEETIDERFKRFKPGVISKNLQKALNLKHNEVPTHIYKMRIHGYPPGWLEYAKFDNLSPLKGSILNIFGCDTISRNACDEKNDQNFDKFVDPNKIFSFKGFNEPLDERVRDLHHRHNCPAMSRNHSRKNYIFELNNKKSNNLSKKEVKKRKRPSSEKIDKCCSVKKRKVHVSDDNNNNSNNNNKEEEKITSLNEVKIAEDKSIENIDTDIDNNIDSGIETDVSFESINNPNFSFRTETGTPILSNVSRYTQIPKVENFTKDITPVLYFENLPNATGHFQKLTKVIRNLRNNPSFT